MHSCFSLHIPVYCNQRKRFRRNETTQPIPALPPAFPSSPSRLTMCLRYRSNMLLAQSPQVFCRNVKVLQEELLPDHIRRQLDQFLFGIGLVHPACIDVLMLLRRFCCLCDKCEGYRSESSASIRRFAHRAFSSREISDVGRLFFRILISFSAITSGRGLRMPQTLLIVIVSKYLLVPPECQGSIMGDYTNTRAA